ncbi:hypothetical protein ACFU8I_02320 [Streptomyces sp. NPDC057540]|uniref:hypothetical protein n=1 Tax=Streptomyces sp. NPDC057540 TaxID=3346160 RepID=UPI00367ABFEB
MTTRAYGRTSWPWAAAAVLLFWQTWYLFHVYATENSGVRWDCDSEGCGTNDLAGPAIPFAVVSAVLATVFAAPRLGVGGAGVAALLAAFGLLVRREDDHALLAAYGLAALGVALVLTGAVRAVVRGPAEDRDEDRDGEREESPHPRGRPALPALLRLLVAPATLLAAVPGTLAATGFVLGALDGPRWIMMLGLNGTVALLVALGLARLGHRPGVAGGPVPAGRAAHAPALLNGLRTRGTAFVFDLTVRPERGAPYRIEVEHPLDLQDVRGHRAALVRHDPRRPWLVDLPQDPPAAALARARAAAGDPASAPRLRAPAPGTPALLVTGVFTTVLVTLLAVA